MRRLEMVLSRLAWFVPTMVGLIVVVFLISNVIPTDPVRIMAGENSRSTRRPPGAAGAGGGGGTIGGPIGDTTGRARRTRATPPAGAVFTVFRLSFSTMSVINTPRFFSIFC